MSALTCPSCGRGSPADAAFCSSCGAKLGPTAAAHESRKVVTALFCDLVGSTSLGERHDPEVLRPLLERYFAEAREAVERHGGRVEKFIGDAVCAVFGVPAVHEDDALRAVRAGLEVQERLARLREGAPIPLEARVGITTGEVLVAGGGGPLIGDAMNTASRLQSGAAPGEVLVGEPTWRLVRDAVAAEPAPPLAAKGKAEPVPAWRVLALAPGSPARARRLDAPMVGRDREAALLAGAYRGVVEGRACRLFTVLGVAGAGKSRLVEEFLGSLGDTAEVLRGRCLSYGEGITWLPLAEALRPALGLAEFAGPDDVAAAVRAAAAGEGPDAAAVAAGLGGLFGLPGSGSAEQTAWAVRRLLEARARERPVVLVLDDVHWAEPALLDLVEHLAERADGPLLLLCMARPELLDARPGWGAGAGPADAVHLAPLAPADADALVGALLGGAALPAGARERVTSAAGGNPLFLEEVLRMLVDEGRLAREGDAWVVAGDLSGLRIPPTVSALLSSRLDRLPEGERSVLEAASVEGQSFSVGALEALLPEASRDALPGLLRSLARKDLVVPERRSGPGRDGYRFRHLLIRDAAYDAIPKSSRARLHLAFADWLEAAAGDAHRGAPRGPRPPPRPGAPVPGGARPAGRPGPPAARREGAGRGRGTRLRRARRREERRASAGDRRRPRAGHRGSGAVGRAALEHRLRGPRAARGQPAPGPQPRGVRRRGRRRRRGPRRPAPARICRPLHHRPRGRPPRRPPRARAVPCARRPAPRARRPPEAQPGRLPRGRPRGGGGVGSGGAPLRRGAGLA